MAHAPGKPPRPVVRLMRDGRGVRSWSWWRPRLAQACLLAAALFVVALVVYSPHMGLLEGRVNPTGGVEGRSEEDPWLRLGTGYAQWVRGEHEDYRYPLHVDEHVHWVRSVAVQRDETIRFDHPYTGKERSEMPMTLRGLIHESGYWVAFAQLQELTGVPWLHLIRFMPAAFAVLTASLVWAALRPSPAAPLAAAFIALVPSSARFLGIGFWVPIGLGLAWVAAALLLSRQAFMQPRWFVLALMMGAWAFFIHLIAGFAFVMVVGAAALVSWGENRSRTVLLAAGVLLPFIAFYDAFQASFVTEIERLGRLPIDFTWFDQLGVPVLFLWAAGCALVFLVPPTGRARVPLVAATLVSLAALLLIVVNVVFGLQMYAIYDRWHMVFAMMVAIPAAWALYMAWRGVRLAILMGWRLAVEGRAAVDGRPAQAGDEDKMEAPVADGGEAAFSVEAEVGGRTGHAGAAGPSLGSHDAKSRPATTRFAWTHWSSKIVGFTRDSAAHRPPAGVAAVLGVVGVLLVSGLFVLAASPGLAAHLDEPYYRVMDDDAWRAFQVAKDLGPEYEVFLTHPWQAPVFAALSGKHPHTWLNPGSPPIRGEDYAAYMQGRYDDGVWLVSRDISLVISPRAPTDPAFETIAPNVHVLDRELALALYEARTRR